jgi:hypothetical protein
VIALSPKTLMATNRFVCEICNKGFQRDQNLQLHRRGNNLPWKLKQRNSKRSEREPMFAMSLHVFTTILQGPSVILQELRNTIAGNMGRRSGSVTNALRSMLFNLISMLFFFSQ